VAEIKFFRHVDDLCAAFDRALELNLTGALNVAEAEGVTMRRFILALAERMRRRVVLVGVPAGPAIHLLKGIEKLHVPVPISSENVLGLMSMQHVSTENDVARLGVRIRSAGESLDDLIR